LGGWRGENSKFDNLGVSSGAANKPLPSPASIHDCTRSRMGPPTARVIFSHHEPSGVIDHLDLDLGPDFIAFGKFRLFKPPPKKDKHTRAPT